MAVSNTISPEEAPSDFYCPITCEIFRDPLMCRSGLSFERNAILVWLHQNPNGTCPVTRKPLSVRDLVPNRALQERIRSWCSRNGIDLKTRGSKSLDAACTTMTYRPIQDAVLPCYLPGVSPSDCTTKKPKADQSRRYQWFSLK